MLCWLPTNNFLEVVNMAKTGRPPKNWPIEQLRVLIEVENVTHNEAGIRLGIPCKYVSGLCKRHGIRCQRRGPRSGPGHPDWKGGIYVSKGYRYIYAPWHPSARKGKPYVPEHRLVMERHLERILDCKEVVHHKNKDPLDNRIENLELFGSNADHLRHELTGKCPRWTEEGRQNILRAVRRKSSNHLESEQHAPSMP